MSIQYVTRPASVYTPADLLAPSLTAGNYILITHSAFWTEALRLADYRAKDYKVALIDVQQIYDQFNGGMMSAEAIRDFLAHVYANWAPAPPTPRYVLLLGDGTSDMRALSWGGGPTYIPPYLYPVDPYPGEDGRRQPFRHAGGRR